jgi:hypothetical protein
MRHRINIILKLAVLLLTCCFPICEGGAAGSTWQASHLIIPGIRVCAITPQTSESELQKIYGRKNVRGAEVDVGEGEHEPGAVIYPDNPTKTIEVIWKDAHEKRRPKQVRLTGENSVCRTRQGISLGTRLKELERINGRPFELTGFSYDLAGTVVSWEGGKLEKQFDKRGRVILRLDYSYKSIYGLSEKELHSVDGDQLFSSNNRVMQKINPKVYQIVVEFPED